VLKDRFGRSKTSLDLAFTRFCANMIYILPDLRVQTAAGVDFIRDFSKLKE
jgi:hypothetical protein